MTNRVSFSKWIGFITVLSATLLLWIVSMEGSDQTEKLLLWSRYTARPSLLVFMLVTASALNYFLSNRGTQFIWQNRRNLGLPFAYAHGIHLVALSSYMWVSGEQRTPDSLIIGTLVYLMIFAMALTSSNNAVAKMGLVKWKRLHRIGVHSIAFVFVLIYLVKLVEGQPQGSASDAAMLTLLFGILLVGYLLRVVH
jgi:methionine sulfoxide reductase heme-binding subunit